MESAAAAGRPAAIVALTEAALILAGNAETRIGVSHADPPASSVASARGRGTASSSPVEQS